MANEGTQAPAGAVPAPATEEDRARLAAVLGWAAAAEEGAQQDVSSTWALTGALWEGSTLHVDVEAPSVPSTRVMFDPRADRDAPAFAVTSRLRITYRGRSIPDALHRELEALRGRIDALGIEDLRRAAPPRTVVPTEDAERDPDGGLRAPTCTDLGPLPGRLGLLGPDDPPDALRLCAAQWWGHDLVLEIDGPELRPAIVALSRRQPDVECFVATEHLALSHETELTEPLARAFEELRRSWAELTVDAILEAFPAPARVLHQSGMEVSAHCPHEGGLGGEAGLGPDTDAVSRGWAPPEQWHRFLCSWEMDRNILRSVQLSHQAIYVEHGDLECLHSTPGFRKRVPSFVNYPWPDVQAPPGQGGEDDLVLAREDSPRSYTSDMNEADVVLGAADKLDELLEAVSREHPDRPIHFNCTCPPIVIADEVDTLITKIRKKHEAPVVHTTQDPGSSLHLFASMLRGEGYGASDEPVEPDPDAVNLVGFAADRGRQELVELLAALGLRLNAMLIPSAPRDEVERYRRAAAQIFFPNAPWRVMYHAAFHDLPMESITPPAPFGPTRVRAWLAEIAAALGREDRLEDAWQRAWQPLAPRWEALREEASEHRLLFVVDRHDLRRLATPDRMVGRPVFELLDEMRFGIDLLCYGAEEGLAQEAAARLGELPDAGGRGHATETFRTPAELDEALREASASAAFSEIFFDRRLTRAGKAQFHAGMLEQGPAGAVRSLERLLSVCRLPFYRRLGRYLDRGRAHG